MLNSHINRLRRGSSIHPFIKVSCAADEKLLGVWIVELPSLVLWRITNKDALLGVRL